MTWLAFAMLTVVTWGLYGIALHAGATLMGGDQAVARMKAFLLVGVAYFVIAVVAPIVILLLYGKGFAMTPKGATWSLVAGTVGAIGALGVLLAFGAEGKPPVVMSIIFAGAPVVNAVVAGILMAAAGGCLVTYYKPPPPKPAAQRPAAAAAAPSPGNPSSPAGEAR
jgi:hypothetical protein